MPLLTADVIPDSIPAHEVERLRASIARDSLPDFIEYTWEMVEPGTELSWNWHLDELCEVLGAVTRGEIKRLIVNVPPGTSKSLTVSVFWPAWMWARNPELRFFTASYSKDLTIRDNRRLRAIVTSDWYRAHFDLRLAGDQSAKIRFDTTAKGWRIASSVGGGGTGEHPDFIIIDDPLKAEDSRSETARRSVADWFEGTVATRVARDPAMVLIMQRLHEQDLAGRLLAKGGWEHICFPMRFEAERSDPRDHRTEPGGLLWPELWPEEKVRHEEMELGPYGTAGQLQQRPAPEGGGLFKRHWFKIVDETPAQALRCRGWDTASTEGGGDYTAGVKISRTAEGLFYVEHVYRDQIGPAMVDKTIHSLATFDGRGCRVREEQEPGSSGKAVTAARSRTLAGYDYSGVPVTGDKVTRARPFRAQCEAGNVRLVRGEWNEGYIQELCVFPAGAHDDQVDASSCAFNELTGGPGQARSRKAVWG